MIDSAIDTFENTFYQMTYEQLSAETCSRLDDLLESSYDEEKNEFIEGENNDILTFRHLLASPGKPSVSSSTNS